MAVTKHRRREGGKRLSDRDRKNKKQRQERERERGGGGERDRQTDRQTDGAGRQTGF